MKRNLISANRPVTHTFACPLFYTENSENDEFTVSHGQKLMVNLEGQGLGRKHIERGVQGDLGKSIWIHLLE